MGFLLAPVIVALGGMLAMGMIVGGAFALTTPVLAHDSIPSGTSSTVAVGVGTYRLLASGSNRADARAVTVVITDPSGEAVEVTASHGSYDASGGRTFEEIGEVRIPVAGRYEFTVAGPPGSAAALGRPPEDLYWTLVIAGIVVFVCSVLTAVVLVTTTIVRRRRRRVAALPPPSLAGPPPPPVRNPRSSVASDGALEPVARPLIGETGSMSAPVRPRMPWVGFVVAPIVLVVGVVIAAAMIVGSVFVLASTITGFEDVPSGTARTLTLSSGTYTVFGAGPTSASALRVDVEVIDASGGRIPVTFAGSHLDASDGGVQYQSIGEVRIPTAGSYRVAADGPAGTSASIGKFSLLPFLALLIGGFVVGGVFLVIAVVILIVTLVRRMRRERAWRAAAPAIAAPAAPPRPPLPPPPPPLPSSSSPSPPPPPRSDP